MELFQTFSPEGAPFLRNFVFDKLKLLLAVRLRAQKQRELNDVYQF